MAVSRPGREYVRNILQFFHRRLVTGLQRGSLVAHDDRAQFSRGWISQSWAAPLALRRFCWRTS